MKTIEFDNIKFYVGQSAKENWNILDTAKSIKKDICGLIGGSDFSIFEWNNADLDEE